MRAKRNIAHPQRKVFWHRIRFSFRGNARPLYSSLFTITGRQQTWNEKDRQRQPLPCARAIPWYATKQRAKYSEMFSADLSGPPVAIDILTACTRLPAYLSPTYVYKYPQGLQSLFFVWEVVYEAVAEVERSSWVNVTVELPYFVLYVFHLSRRCFTLY